MPSKVIIIVIEFMFLGINIFWALLRAHFNPRLTGRAKVGLSRAQNIFVPGNINSIVLLFVDISVIKSWITMILVKWNDIISISLHWFELSNQIDCNNLVGPIGLQSNSNREELLCSFFRGFLYFNLVAWFVFKQVICNKQIVTCLEPDIVFITLPLTRSFAIWY